MTTFTERFPAVIDRATGLDPTPARPPLDDRAARQPAVDAADRALAIEQPTRAIGRGLGIER